MSRSRTMPLLAILAAVTLLLAACGGGGGETSTPEDGGATSEAPMESEAAATDGEESPGDGAMTAEVVISGFDFGDDITVEAGTTVTFVNEDDAAHTVTEGTGGEAADDARFDEEVAGGGESVEITFDEAGEVEITCRFHPTMQLTVTVEG